MEGAGRFGDPYAGNDSVIFAGSDVVIDRHNIVVRKGLAEKVEHALARGAIRIVAELKPESHARLGVEPDDGFDVDLVVRGTVAGAHVVHSKETDPSAGFPEVGVDGDGHAGDQ